MIAGFLDAYLSGCGYEMALKTAVAAGSANAFGIQGKKEIERLMNWKNEFMIFHKEKKGGRQDEI